MSEEDYADEGEIIRKKRAELRLHAAGGWRPDVFVHLELHSDGKAIFENP